MAKLNEEHKKNIKFLMDALLGQYKNVLDIALMQLQRKSDNEEVVALVVVTQDLTDPEKIFTIPLAVMIEGNPFEQFNPPDPDNDDKYLSSDDILDANKLEEKDVPTEP